MTSDDLALSPALLFDLGRFVREGVANAVRHGGAGSVEIVAGADAGLRIAIRDDGRVFGFTGTRDHATLAREGGPRSLHERATALGGRLSVESGAQGGCVILDLPMEGR